jgi:hypothetical protein
MQTFLALACGLSPFTLVFILGFFGLGFAAFIAVVTGLVKALNWVVEDR